MTNDKDGNYVNGYNIFTYAINLFIDQERYAQLTDTLNNPDNEETYNPYISNMFLRINLVIRKELSALEEQFPFLKEERDGCYEDKAMAIAEKENLWKFFPNGRLLYFPITE